VPYLTGGCCDLRQCQDEIDLISTKESLGLDVLNTPCQQLLIFSSAVLLASGFNVVMIPLLLASTVTGTNQVKREAHSVSTVVLG
jgi:hypothetical protein